MPRILVRRDTAANWAATNPYLANGEIGYETDTGKFKIGDTNTWSLIPYFVAEPIINAKIARVHDSPRVLDDYNVDEAVTPGLFGVDYAMATSVGSNLPEPNDGFLIVYKSDNVIGQIFMTYWSSLKTWKRVTRNNGVDWDNWVLEGHHAVVEHEAKTDPHPQYRLESAIAVSSGTLANSLSAAGEYYVAGATASVANGYPPSLGLPGIMTVLGSSASNHRIQRFTYVAGDAISETWRRVSATAGETWTAWVPESDSAYLSTPLDLNTAITPGSYRHNFAATNTNVPVLDSGHLVVYRSGALVYQEWHQGGRSGWSYYRRSADSGVTWNDWARIGNDVVVTHEAKADPHPQYETAAEVNAKVVAHEAKPNPHTQYLLKTASQLGNVDLNTLTTTANYAQPSGAGNSTALNYPTSGWAGYIEVVAWSASWVMQRATGIASDPGGDVHNQTIHVRTCYNGNWGPWFRADTVGHAKEANPHPQYLNKQAGGTVSGELILSGGGRFSAPFYWHNGSSFVGFTAAEGNDVVISADQALKMVGQASVQVTTGSSGTAPYMVNGVHQLKGTGSPEGVVAAPVGSTYVDTAATNGAVRWIKASGSGGTTGWRVEYGDTGWRNITASLPAASAPHITKLHVRRVNSEVHWNFTLGSWPAGLPDLHLADGTIPLGFQFRPSAMDAAWLLALPPASPTGEVRLTTMVGGTGLALRAHHAPAAEVGNLGSMHVTYPADAATPWPTTLPGTAV